MKMLMLFSISIHFLFHYMTNNERGSIVVRAHASHAEGLRFEHDSMLQP